eukprot:COSAG01_NODE_7259_length_3279_cov_1.994025_1_plen_79_part_10
MKDHSITAGKRFAVMDRVRCWFEEKWQDGQIVGVDYVDVDSPAWPDGCDNTVCSVYPIARTVPATRGGRAPRGCWGART